VPGADYRDWAGDDHRRDCVTHPGGIAPAAPTAHREPLNTSLQVRVWARTRDRLDEAVRKLQYELKDRSVSLSSIANQALDAWLTQQGI
jgi:hypothetical protein